MLLFNLAGSASEYQKIKDLKLFEIMAYLDIAEKTERYTKIKEQEDKIENMMMQFGQKAPQKF